MTGLQYLEFELSDATDGVHTLDALAEVRAEARQAVRAEIDRVLTWAREAFPNGPGPLDNGHDWDAAVHDHEDAAAGWCSLSLTLVGTEAFAHACCHAFAPDLTP